MKDTLFAIGEALIDFMPDEKGCSFLEVKSFSPKVGGAPANVLGAFSKLGGKTELITMLGKDPFGEKIAAELKGFGIGLDYLEFTDRANTALAFVSLAKSGERTFSFYRNPSADMLYSAENLNANIFSDCFALHFCSVSLGDFPMRDAHKKAIEFAKKRGAIISFDPNIRFPLWKDKPVLKRTIDDFLPSADIIKVSDDELEFITGTDEIAGGCGKLLKYARLVLCTCGAKGAYAYTGKVNCFVPAKAVETLDTTGAGDAFIGSFLYNLCRNGINKGKLGSLTKDQLEKFLYDSNNYCGKSVQSYGAIESYPDSI